MPPLPRHVITLMGQPTQNESGSALPGEAIVPGMLVEGTLTIKKHATAGANTPRTFALEQQYVGKGIDVAYLDNDRVRVGSFSPGHRVYAFIASGQNIALDAKLESAGNGTLRTLAAGTALGHALEAVNNAAGSTTYPGGAARIRVEVM